ncbi:type II toxin-antitoxin system PemK/MazF family toxin [Knoellia sp. LjRoot47]|uniref:type II toxin-antitoxin system PemK/MazF family toxin n=1 Tax=Knoellia sp. LjRoot47 TaxID=3342330 RepID=UPI003F4F8C3E
MASYPGDYDGPLDPDYSPEADGEPDPGEVVWAHVPYEEDASRGKDRPVLVVGRDGRWLLGMQLTSKDHDRDEQQEARAGRYWVDVGVGGWDGRGRPSEVRVNRVVRIDPATVRREGAVLDRARWDEVVAAHAAHPHPQRDVPAKSARPSALDRLVNIFRRG